MTKNIPQLLGQPALFEQQYGTKLDWTVQANAEDYTIFNNTGPGDSLAFYRIKKGTHGNPVIIAEPFLAFDAPAELTYVDFKGNPFTLTEKIAGIICQETDGTATYRFSLSSKEAPKFEKTDYGILIDGVPWYLKTLFSKDKNRVINYDAYYSRVKPVNVAWIELANLNFNQLF